MDFMEMWNKTEAATNSNDFEPIPKGTYQAEVTGAKYVSADDRGGDRVEWEFTITGDTHVGRKVWQRNTVDEKGVARLKYNCNMLGMNVTSMQSLMGELESALGKLVNIETWNNTSNGKTYTNCKIVSSLTKDNQDIPF